MRLSTSIFLLLGAVVLQVAGSAIQVLRRSDSLVGLFKRQDSQAACEATCNDFESAINSCTTGGCVCTAANASKLDECVNCAYKDNEDAEQLAAGNQFAGSFNSACAGFPVPSVFVTPIPAGPTSTASRSPPSSAGPSASSTSKPIIITTTTASSTQAPSSPVPTTTKVVTSTANNTPTPTPSSVNTSLSLSPPSGGTTTIPPGAFGPATTSTGTSDTLDPTGSPNSTAGTGNNLPTSSGAVSVGNMYFSQGSVVALLALAVLTL